MTVNPYEPPSDDIKSTPYWKKFQRALARAIREYRAGLVRDNFTAREHFVAWLALFGLLFFLLFFNVLWIAVSFFD